MSKKLFSFSFVVALLLLLFASCKPSVPGKYISKEKMTDILYDYHLADAMYKINQENATKMITYKSAVLKKHGVTEAEFDSSMVYYTRHTKLLQDVYEALSKRMSQDALALGASANDVNANGGGHSSNSDTTNIWRADRSIVLSPYKPFNVYSYAIQADTTFKAGDNLYLNFDAQFIFQDGVKDGMAVMAVKFNNDSVAVQTVYVSSPNHYTLQISDNSKLGIKEIRGYFILNNSNPNDAYSTTLKIMLLTNITLVRVHATKSSEDQSKKDSVDTGIKRSIAADTAAQRSF